MSSETDFTDNSSEEPLPFTNIADTGYRRPRQGTVQSNMTIDDVKAQLVGYIPLQTMEEKQVLCSLQPFKTWIKYINTNNRRFRTGGLLMKVSYPDYIMLVNPGKKLTWSVQLKDNLVFIPQPKEQVHVVKEQETSSTPVRKVESPKVFSRQGTQKIHVVKEHSSTPTKSREERIKDKLYELYKQGKLRLVR